MADTNYREQAAQFNEKMGLSEPTTDRDEDALIRFTVIAEEVGELIEAVNKGRHDAIPEELADIVVTCYTGADTLDIDLPEEFDVEVGEGRFDDRVREEAADIFEATNAVKTAVEVGNDDSLQTALSRLLAHCHRAADVCDVDLAAEFDAKMEYNMQKSGTTESGKVVDDVS